MRGPLTTYLEFRSSERAKDREVIQEVIGVLRSAFDAQTAQARAFQAWMESFNAAGTPKIREWDEDQSALNYLEARGSLPPELQGLSQMETFSKILERMDS